LRYRVLVRRVVVCERCRVHTRARQDVANGMPSVLL
jgi:hypothetical protein